MTKLDVQHPVDDRLKAIREVIATKLGEEFDPSKRYIISIQGVSTSGKSSMSKAIYNYLVDNGISTYMLRLDDFYIVPDGTLEDNFDYDFDNPASMNWDNIFEVFRAIKYNEPYIPVFKRTHASSGAVGRIPNFKPCVLIIEGIYGFNVVSEEIFNTKEFDACNTYKEVHDEFVPNPLDFGDFKIIRLHLTLCKAKALSVRISRDVLVRNIPVESIVKRFESHVWPATERWVRSEKQRGDVQIVHGIFNSSVSNMFVKELLRFFLSKDAPVVLKPIKGDMMKEFSVKCSGNCVLEKKTELVLEDSDALI